MFVLNFRPSSIHPPFPYSTFVCSLTVILFSCLDGGRDGQQGFQENKDEGASHCRLPGLCQRKQGRAGECVTTCMCTNTPQPHAFHGSNKKKILGNSRCFICKPFCIVPFICRVFVLKNMNYSLFGLSIVG